MVSPADRFKRANDFAGHPFRGASLLCRFLSLFGRFNSLFDRLGNFPFN
jgi:hypothetical protein